MAIGWIIGIGVLVIAVAFFIYYNRFATLSNQIDNSLSQIDVQLKKRADLVPNLLSSVKGYAKHESSMIEKVTSARKALLGAGNMSDKIKAGSELQHALKSIFALAEGYPQLKANENFLQLQQELSAIEDKVAYARQYYNDATLDYNNLHSTIPGKWFASLYNFRKKNYLEIKAEERAVPKVEF